MKSKRVLNPSGNSDEEARIVKVPLLGYDSSVLFTDPWDNAWSGWFIPSQLPLSPEIPGG